MRDNQDDVIDRIVDELKTLPAVPADATARVLARVDAARRGGASPESADDDDVIYFPAATDEMPVATAADALPLRSAGPRRRFTVSLPAAIGYALAATLAGFLIRGGLPTRGDEQQMAAASGPATRDGDAARTPVGSSRPTLTPVTAAERDLQEVPVPVQFVLDARRAASVSVVGDFNGWDGGIHPLVRDSASGIWSAVVNVKPGRHVYAFLVDGEAWTLDPRAPRTKDADYGAEQSVLIVGMP